jgi:hypothetical protein
LIHRVQPFNFPGFLFPICASAVGRAFYNVGMTAG